MKQKTLYTVLVVCLIIISVLVTLIISNYQKSYSKDDIYKKDNINDKVQISINKPQNYNYPVYGNRDIDYAYDYDGYWFQPSRWWNNLWNSHSYNYGYGHGYDSNRHRYNRRNYDRHDGLDMHNRHYNNQIHINNQTNQPNHSIPQQSIPQQSIPQSLQSLPQSPQQSSQPIISLVRPISGSDFPFPTLSSSSLIPIMPEEISMSPMSPMQPSVNSIQSIQSISTFTSDLPADFQTNFNYKGPDVKNHSPSPIDMMASQSIGLQPNTVANEIIKPIISMEH